MNEDRLEEIEAMNRIMGGGDARDDMNELIAEIRRMRNGIEIIQDESDTITNDEGHWLLVPAHRLESLLDEGES